ADGGRGFPPIAAIVHSPPIHVQDALHQRDALAAARVDAPCTRRLVAPRMPATIGAARRVLPLRFRRQPLASPLAIGRRLVRVYTIDRMLRPVASVAELTVPLHVFGRITASAYRQRRRSTPLGLDTFGVRLHGHLGPVDTVGR